MTFKRADIRINNPCVNVYLLNSNFRHSVEIINISRTGMRFATDQNVSKGDRLHFKFNIFDEKTSMDIVIKTKVINVYEIDGSYQYGVKYYRFFYWYELYIIEKLIIAGELNSKSIDIAPNVLSKIIPKNTDNKNI